MKLTKRQLRVLISEAMSGYDDLGDDDMSQSLDKPGGSVSVDVDFFDEDGSAAALFPQHPVTVSVTGRNNGMPTVLV